MNCVLGLCLFVAAANAAATYLNKMNHPFPNGYHIDVGIPLGKKIHKIESAIVQGSRIFGGRPSQLREHPFLLASLIEVIGTLNLAVATASMITNTRALWAAHNWNNGYNFGTNVTLAFGSQFVFFGGVRITTNKVEIHPNYNPITLENDIAIIRHEWVHTTSVIEPVALPIGNLSMSTFEWYDATIMGFGVTENGLPANHTQHHANVLVIPNEECRSSFGSLVVVNSTICTSGFGGVSICTGDSGGPLTMSYYNKTVQIGVNSFSGVCGSWAPSGFARVTSFLDWILARL